jgi:hypothetical protein
MIVLMILTCGMVSLGMIDEAIDGIYKSLFGMQKMDVVGFRRLRTSSQLTFESFPQIVLQLYILNYLNNHPDELDDLDVNTDAILISVGLAVLHAVVEMLFIYLEKVANKTSFMHYSIICFNGRFDWVPFTNHFSQQNENSKVERFFNYDDISSQFLCMQFQLNYQFTDDTLQSLTKYLTLLPLESNPVKR